MDRRRAEAGRAQRGYSKRTKKRSKSELRAAKEEKRRKDCSRERRVS